MKFSEKVQLQRSRLGLTQQELGDLAGLTVRSVNSYEAGTSFPRAKQLYRLASIFGVSAEYLKNDDITDPNYGVEQAYLHEVRMTNGDDAVIDAEKLLESNRAFFAGGNISEKAKDSFFQALMKAYLECKAESQNRNGSGE